MHILFPLAVCHNNRAYGHFLFQQGDAKNLNTIKPYSTFMNLTRVQNRTQKYDYNKNDAWKHNSNTQQKAM